MRHYIVIFIWIVIIIASFSAREAITEDVTSSTEIIDSDQDSAVGLNLYKERFNVTDDDTTHIIVLQLPEGESFLDNKWRNYTLFLVQYLNDSLFEDGYDRIIAESILHLQGLDEFGAGLVSDDETTTIISLIATGLSDEELITEHVHKIRALLSADKVNNGIYKLASDYATYYAGLTGADPDIILNSIMPERTDADKINYIVTGNSANFVDIIETAEKSFDESEFLAIIVAIVILALVFKSPLGIFIPILAMVASLLPTYFITTLISRTGLFAISDFLPAIIGMIGIAVAVDYNLFSLVRFREEYRKKKAALISTGDWNKTTKRITQEEAATKTNRTTGNAVMYSGFTVIIGFSSMLVLGNDFTLGMAVSVSTVVAISILTARTLTVSILALFGDILDWPNIISGGSREIKELQGTRKHHKTIWERWSKAVLKKPYTFLFIGILTMTPFIITSFDMDLSFDFVKSLPPESESRQGFEVLQNEFDFGSLNPMQVVVDLGSDFDMFAPQNADAAKSILNSVEELANWSLAYSEVRTKDDSLMEFDGFSAVSVVNTGIDSSRFFEYEELQGMLLMSTMPVVPAMNYTDPLNPTPIINSTTGLPILVENPYYYQAVQFVGYMGNYINMDYGNNTLKIDITTPLDPGSAAAWELVEILRAEIDDIFGDNEYVVDLYVTGLSAIFRDSSFEMYENVPLMIIVATTLIFLALLVLFRSIALPIKAILTISGSILFGLGSLVMIFQYGWLPELSILGTVFWTSEVVGVSYFLPTFLFTTILGLGMDYSILIISRIKEEYDKTGDMDESVGIGISKTAGVITSAATIMIATFLVFASSPMLVLKMLGIALAVSIAVDATISRILLLPAAMKLLGSTNWWLPRWLDKILPKIELEH